MRHNILTVSCLVFLIFMLPCPLFAECERITWEVSDASGYDNVIADNRGSQSSSLTYVYDVTRWTAYIRIHSYGSPYPGYSDAECDGKVIVLGEKDHWYLSILSKYKQCRISVEAWGWCVDPDTGVVGGSHCPDEERAPIGNLVELMDAAKYIIDKKCPIEAEYIISPSGVEIGVGKKVKFLVFEVTDIGTELVSKDQITWLIPESKPIDPYWEEYLPGGKVGEIDQNGEFTGINIGTCIVAAKIDRIDVNADVTVKCPEDELGDLEGIKTWYYRRIQSNSDLQMPGLWSPLVRFLSLKIGLSPGLINNFLMYVPVARLEKFDNFKCGAYQVEVLKFLHKIQADPKECALLNGYEFGPIQGNHGGHHSVVIFPKDTDWKKTGTVLDPWLLQTPTVFTIDEWREKFSPVAGETEEAYRKKYPTTWDPSDYGAGADFFGYLGRGWEYAYNNFNNFYIVCLKFVSSKKTHNILNSSLSFEPATVLIKDGLGGKCGVLNDESITCDVPDTFFMRIPVIEEGFEGYEWFFIINSDTCKECELEFTGAVGGELTILTGNSRRRIRYYPRHPIMPGETGKLDLDINALQALLRLSDGSKVHPIPIRLPIGYLVPIVDLLLLE